MMIVSINLKIKAILHESYELQSFPFDCQDLKIKLKWEESTKILNIIPNLIKNKFININTNKSSLNEWQMYKPIAEL